MKYKRKSSMMVRLAALLVVTMMFTMCFVGGTFAKYTSSAGGTDGASVAKWNIKVNNANIVKTDIFTFDLFDTIKDSDLINAETDMAPADGSIIAPGTGGKFDIVIKNDSQVNATYKIDYTVTNENGIPVKFSTDKTQWHDSIGQLNVSDVQIDKNASATVTVYWKWNYEGNPAGDTADTALGKAAAGGTNVPGIFVSAKVTATQVD